ncbi:hypothetical protein DPMN_075523 [Dreissena polymorpha]|uniref:Uncharacterized protein n=1 Tax=Dreissena polymorpha TaxID=45954 RepID=A0A9D3YH66_DREPO|nr:hypothetical protein DPMN_075523 [Dreissena polymorpha]
MGAVAAIVVLAVFASALLVVLLCIYKRTGCYLRRGTHARSNHTYLTTIHIIRLKQHDVDINVCA